MKPAPNRFPISCVLTLILGFNAVAVQAADKSPPNNHVWDQAALARCSSSYQREIIADSQARDGKAVRFTGEAGFISMHDEIPIVPGRNRFTIRLRLPQDEARRRFPDLDETADARRRSPDLAETADRRSPGRAGSGDPRTASAGSGDPRTAQGGRFATDFEVGGKGFQSCAPIEFADLPADGSFTERVVELNLPGPLNVVSLRGGLPRELIVDRIEVESVAGAATVEVASAQMSKLVYAPDEAGEANVLLANYSGRERPVRLRVVVESGIHDEKIVAERDVTLPGTTSLQATRVPIPPLPSSGYQLRAEAIEEDEVVSVARDIFVVTDRPLRAGQYGNFAIHQPYSAAEADANVAAFRRNFVTVTEICF